MGTNCIIVIISNNLVRLSGKLGDGRVYFIFYFFLLHGRKEEGRERGRSHGHGHGEQKEGSKQARDIVK